MVERNPARVGGNLAVRWRVQILSPRLAEIHRGRHAPPSANVSGVEGGWQPYPGALPGEAAFQLPPVKPGRIVGLGAICDVGARHADPRDQSFSVSEFATLEDGRRVLLHDRGRGFTIGVRSTGECDPRDVRRQLTLEGLASEVLLVVLPDDDDDPEPHPWSWLSDLAQARGLDVTASGLRELPYDVVFTDELCRWLAAYREGTAGA